MSFFRSSSSSTSGSLVTKVAPRPVLAFLYPDDIPQASRRSAHPGHNQAIHNSPIPISEGFEAWFISSLVQAGHCSGHHPHVSIAHSQRRPLDARSHCMSARKLVVTRHFHSKAFAVKKLHNEPVPPGQIKDGDHDITQPDLTSGKHKLERHLKAERASVLAGEASLNLIWTGKKKGVTRLPTTNTTTANWSQVGGRHVSSSTKLSREEAMEFVDQYNGQPFFTNQHPTPEPASAIAEEPDREEQNQAEPLPWKPWPADDETSIKLDSLQIALGDWYMEPEHVYKIYASLPEPRATYLSDEVRHLLLRHLSVVDSKNEFNMLRYFSVIDDVKSAGLALAAQEWTSALSFAARYVSISTEVEVEAALHMWKEMENEAGVKGTDATFNVLYDVACKAGKFTLAEMIYKEMRSRGLQYTRYHHVSIIFACGLRADGDGARAAYKALIDAGELVDTLVLNAMISALLSAREPEAAENIYERMKKLHIAQTGAKLPPDHFKERRLVNSRLLKWAKICQKCPEKRQSYQERTIIAPDTRTYRLLVRYFAKAGDLNKAATLLSEMSIFRVPLHGALFLTLFKGFAVHGGLRYTDWDQPRLEGVWAAFKKALDSDVEGLYMSKWMVHWVLKAFARCAGKERSLSVWEDIQAGGRWMGDEGERDFVLTGLRWLMEDSSCGQKRRVDWVLGE